MQKKLCRLVKIRSVGKSIDKEKLHTYFFINLPKRLDIQVSTRTNENRKAVFAIFENRRVFFYLPTSFHIMFFFKVVETYLLGTMHAAAKTSKFINTIQQKTKH